MQPFFIFDISNRHTINANSRCPPIGSLFYSTECILVRLPSVYKDPFYLVCPHAVHLNKLCIKVHCMPSKF